MDNIRKELKEIVRRKLDYVTEADDDEIRGVIDETILSYGRDNFLPMKQKQLLGKEIFNSIRRLDILQELIENDDISEIMINGFEDIFIEIRGEIHKWDKQFESREKLEDIIQQMVSKANRMVNESNPIVDARLSDGSRIHVVLAPVAVHGPAVTIRKFPLESITMEQLIEWNTITMDAAILLKKLVAAQYNIFVSGGTGSGKTTLLNVLSNFIPQEERVITIEDSAELQIRNVPNVVSLETRESILEESRKITMENLIKASLRMRPNRVIIGEVRDGDAVVNMLQALNTGAAGLSTGHANSAKDMLSRLEALALMGANMPLLSARKQIASAIDIIVHLGRLRDKTRRVLEISEVMECGEEQIRLNTLFLFKEMGESADGKIIGELAATNNTLKYIDKLKMAGIQ